MRTSESARGEKIAFLLPGGSDTELWLQETCRSFSNNCAELLVRLPRWVKTLERVENPYLSHAADDLLVCVMAKLRK